MASFYKTSTKGPTVIPPHDDATSNGAVSVGNVTNLAGNHSVSKGHDSNTSTPARSGLSAFSRTMFGAVANKVVSDIKSSAVVQFNPIKFPTNFLTIRLNTNLNCQPSGWAKKKDLMFPNPETSHNENDSFSPFSCLNMAHSNQDLVGRVDVISSSKNIKDLLKMPYQSSPHISIMVHRLGRTLLLEEFDVHKHLIKKQTEEWQWLRSFYHNIVSKAEDMDKSRYLVSPITKRESFSDEMYLNLIRHSFAASVENEYTVVESGTDLPRQVHRLPGGGEDLRGFHHESLWKFEDISMLIESDLPIFGTESRRPCISLRLRDSRSPPINVLTGLDYWLDNLMSNVPEVAMCYHLNGFVQKYEVIRTEDIPNFENSNFDPKEVMGIARNIMAFIKSNAAVEGHTYWLYKSEHDEMVKLYDLTQHCQNELSEGDNPFTVPVGLLCYRVGRNLKMSGQRRSADARAMLENSLRLLDENKHALVCADAHFHLSDMWVPDRSVNDVWQDGGRLAETPSDLYDDDDDTSTDESFAYESDSGGSNDLPQREQRALTMSDKPSSPVKFKGLEEEKIAVALKELVVRGMTKHRAWDVLRSCRIAGETDERCKMGLGHIRKGLCCIDKVIVRLKPFDPSEEQKQEEELLSTNENFSSSVDDDREKVQSANPYVAIPLHYTPLKNGSNKNQESSSTDAHNSTNEKTCPESTSQSSSGVELNPDESEGHSGESTTTSTDSNIPWHFKIKFNLLRKAAITYFVFSKQFFEIKRYGQALRHLRYAVHCWESLEVLIPSERSEPQDQELHLMLLYLAATTRCSLSSSQWSSFHKEFEELEEEEAAILHSAQLVLPIPKLSWIYQWPNNMERNLKTAQQLFKIVMRLPALEKKNASFRGLMKKQYAACLMLIGNTQMETLKDRIKNGSEDFTKVKPLWNECLESFLLSRDLFSTLNDRNTSGHVCNNVAYLHVLAALACHSPTKDLKNPIGKEEKENLLKAVDWYEKSLHTYERGEDMDQAREKIFSSLRLQYYQMACRYFEIPMKSLTTEHIRTMKDYLQKSLSYCHMDSVKHGKQSRICGALCHLNIARVYEVEFSMIGNNNNQRKRLQRQKMEENYRTAFEIYDELKWRRSQISVKDIWIKSLMDELEKKSQPGHTLKKGLKIIYGHFCDLQDVIDQIGKGNLDATDQSSVFKDELSAVKQTLSRLNKTLCNNFKMDKTNSVVKKLYERCLRLTNDNKLKSLVQHLSEIFNDLRESLVCDSSV